jgi:hypothetical protein
VHHRRKYYCTWQVSSEGWCSTITILVLSALAPVGGVGAKSKGTVSSILAGLSIFLGKEINKKKLTLFINQKLTREFKKIENRKNSSAKNFRSSKIE